MNRKLLFVIALIFVLIGVLCIVQNVQRTKASGTVYIRVDGSVEGTDRIQRDGDIYTFSGDIDDDIVVERSNIIIDGNGYTLQGPGGLIPSKDGISLSGRTNVTIKNMKIREFHNGIWLNMSSNNSLYGNNITENRQGILLDWSQNNSITENSIIDNLEGIYLWDSSSNIIVGNNITGNNEFGVYFSSSEYNLLRNNRMSDNKYNLDVSDVNDVDTSNTVDGKPVYYWIDKQDKTVPLDAGYVALINCTRITVKNLSLTNNGQGLLLLNTTDSKIANNNITNNFFAISLGKSSNNTISSNNITNNGLGIGLSQSSNNIIHGNNITHSLGIGITLGEAFMLNVTSNNIISGNNITNNQLGIQLFFSSNNTISENNIVDNNYGIQLNSHSMVGYTSNNTIYHNNFINTEQVWVIELGDIPTHAYTNFWDDGYPSGGNYWSDYGDKYPGAEEIDESGIWNTPYVINENNQDNYPLVSPWGPAWKPPEPSRTPGVSETEWFKYGDIGFNWTSNDPNATIPGFEWNEIEWTMIAIVDVSGTNVAGQMTTHFKNETEKVVGGYVDIETGEGENMTMFVISANLEENDTVYTSGEMSLVKINETIVRTYPDGVRETNHLNLTVEFSYMEFYQYMSTNYYWDKTTGILVEMSTNQIYQTGEYVTNSSLLLKITESNVWIIPELPSLLIPLFMIATLLVAIVYRRKHSVFEKKS